MIKIELKTVKKSDLTFLYDLLSERESNTNISHRKMPTKYQHQRFVFSKPYKKWYIIYCNGKKSGSIYLSKNDEIGISIKREFNKTKVKQAALKQLMEKNHRTRYYANVNPKNSKATKFFKKNGFKLIQHIYELKKNN